MLPLRRKSYLQSLIVSLLVLSAACAPTTPPTSAPAPTSTAPVEVATPTEPPENQPLVFGDGLGREVILSGPAQRIISLAPSNTEILFAIGAGDQVIGRDEASDYPPQALDVASIGSTYGELNTEAILALEPDLVLAATITSPEQVEALENLGITLYLLPNPMTFDELFDNLLTVGALTGHTGEAEALQANLQSRVQAVTSAMQSVELVKAFYEVDGSDPTAPWTTGTGTFQDVLISMVGGENVAAGLEGWGQINLETIVTANPEVIFFGAGPWIPTTAESLSARSGWGEIEAVKSGRIHPIDTNWVDRPGPRLVDALELMASLMHPEKFE
jgi:iron complex transport system substrate-binding protein